MNKNNSLEFRLTSINPVPTTTKQCSPFALRLFAPSPVARHRPLWQGSSSQFGASYSSFDSDAKSPQATAGADDGRSPHRFAGKGRAGNASHPFAPSSAVQ